MATTTNSRTENPAHFRDSGKPGRDCPLCPRLVAFRNDWRKREPGWFNAPVASFGGKDARLLIVGLAPGLQGANRTGRPFTGDYAGDLLYATLIEFGFRARRFRRRARTTASKWSTPASPTACAACRRKTSRRRWRSIPAADFLTATIAEMKNLRAIVALGRVAHDTVVTALGVEKIGGAVQAWRPQRASAILMLFDSYHCSRYNTNTGVLTPEMFRAVFADVRDYLARRPSRASASRAGAKTGSLTSRR